MGSGPVELVGVPVEILPWTEENEVAAIQNFDVGIMPLPDGPWERGKCGYKLIQYMACGRPVVASPVGVNRQIVEHGVNGFLANDTADWITALRELRDNAPLREAMDVLAGAKWKSSIVFRLQPHAWRKLCGVRPSTYRGKLYLSMW
ncbi:glycosyltransferase [Acetomicrobium sp.]|uniref:glycosyltransferase n=1 Tax=Acetomicrobium sp. TaxID=1872099 RepID=UPI002871CBB2|nr:glycosyltransferase [Acetomicrobium sp.]MDR9769432.1 glycosyltransferase [Acetomicrobium sp.]